MGVTEVVEEVAEMETGGEVLVMGKEGLLVLMERPAPAAAERAAAERAKAAALAEKAEKAAQLAALKVREELLVVVLKADSMVASVATAVVATAVVG